MHFAQKCHEHRCLSRTGGPNDEIEFALLENHLVVNMEAESLPRRCQTALRGVIGPREVCMSKADVVDVFGRGIWSGLVRRFFGETVK